MTDNRQAFLDEAENSSDTQGRAPSKPAKPVSEVSAVRSPRDVEKISTPEAVTRSYWRRR